MDELLKLSDKDLINHKRVVEAYWKLKGETPEHQWEPTRFGEICKRCKVHDFEQHTSRCKVPGPVEVVAFAMRNACYNEGDDYPHYRWRMILHEICAYHAHCRISTEAAPKQWIIAAVLAWEESQE